MKRVLDVLREDFSSPAPKKAAARASAAPAPCSSMGSPVNSCLVPAAHLDGVDVMTIEAVSRRHAPPAAGGVCGAGRRAVRHLHAGDDHGGARRPKVRRRPRSRKRWPGTCAVVRDMKRSIGRSRRVGLARRVGRVGDDAAIVVALAASSRGVGRRAAHAARRRAADADCRMHRRLRQPAFRHWRRSSASSTSGRSRSFAALPPTVARCGSAR